MAREKGKTIKSMEGLSVLLKPEDSGSGGASSEKMEGKDQSEVAQISEREKLFEKADELKARLEETHKIRIVPHARILAKEYYLGLQTLEGVLSDLPAKQKTILTGKVIQPYAEFNVRPDGYIQIRFDAQPDKVKERLLLALEGKPIVEDPAERGLEKIQAIPRIPFTPEEEDIFRSHLDNLKDFLANEKEASSLAKNALERIKTELKKVHTLAFANDPEALHSVKVMIEADRRWLILAAEKFPSIKKEYGGFLSRLESQAQAIDDHAKIDIKRAEPAVETAAVRLTEKTPVIAKAIKTGAKSKKEVKAKDKKPDESEKSAPSDLEKKIAAQMSFAVNARTQADTLIKNNNLEGLLELEKSLTENQNELGRRINDSAAISKKYSPFYNHTEGWLKTLASHIERIRKSQPESVSATEPAKKTIPETIYTERGIRDEREQLYSDMDKIAGFHVSLVLPDTSANTQTEILIKTKQALGLLSKDDLANLNGVNLIAARANERTDQRIKFDHSAVPSQIAESIKSLLAEKEAEDPAQPVVQEIEQPAPAKVEFGGELEIAREIARENLTEFKKWLLSAYEIDDEEMLQEALGAARIALLNGDLEQFLRLSNDPDANRFDEDIYRQIVTNNVPYLKTWLLRSYKISDDMLRESLGGAYESLGFNEDFWINEDSEIKDEFFKELADLEDKQISINFDSLPSEVSNKDSKFEINFNKVYRFISRIKPAMEGLDEHALEVSPVSLAGGNPSFTIDAQGRIEMIVDYDRTSENEIRNLYQQALDKLNRIKS